MAEERHSPGPILAPPGSSPCQASRPETELEERRYNTYEHNPVPWWVALVLVLYVIFGAAYLFVNVIE